jgi:hypothetical protein
VRMYAKVSTSGSWSSTTRTGTPDRSGDSIVAAAPGPTPQPPPLVPCIACRRGRGASFDSMGFTTSDRTRAAYFRQRRRGPRTSGTAPRRPIGAQFLSDRKTGAGRVGAHATPASWARADRQ